MPISLDDQARLPPLTPYDEVVERQRLADMKAFRKHLVDTGAVKCLVKLYQHTAKNEMRLDNPRILKEFLSSHVEETEETRECEQLEAENGELRDRNAALQAQAEALAKALDEQRRLKVGKDLWQLLVSAEFWEGELDEDARAAGLPLNLLFRRLCGQKVDKKTGKILINLLRPSSHDEKEVNFSRSLSLDDFSSWVATGIPETLHEWCRDDLLPRLTSVPVASEPPYERELLQAIRDTGLYPDHLHDVADLVSLDPPLISFLDEAVAKFR